MRPDAPNTPVRSARSAARALALLAALGGSLAWAAPAAAYRWEMDRSHSQVKFAVDHLGYSLVHGWFREFDADIDLDPDAVERASVSFRIRADSVDTNWEGRDRYLRGPDFLDAEAHPVISFVSTRVRLVSAEVADITGDLTINGVTRSETLRAALNKYGPSALAGGEVVAGFTISGEIDRTAYGVSFAAPHVGKDVEIRVDLEISPRP
ncbi:YceI family protein [Albimonas pacifica]|uniref:Polyisoprenoid-binding protein YceI n=1 Tax=Albimonas pacifica TaxID=1114924 RepID=A0A1I3IQY7_9RHOB|nr:YceI family protein [Albimonas pacifica]SFI50381.1 Polyisoprenoid-binding protein YceI [Albimonas pacifica]